MRLAAISLVLAFAGAACSDGPTSVTNGAVRVKREATGIRIDNLTDAPRAYLAHDPDLLALANLSLLSMCLTPDKSCLRLPARGSVLVQFSEVAGYGSSTKSIVVWTWRVVASTTPGEDAYEQIMDEAVTLRL